VLKLKNFNLKSNILAGVLALGLVALPYNALAIDLDAAPEIDSETGTVTINHPASTSQQMTALERPKFKKDEGEQSQNQRLHEPAFDGDSKILLAAPEINSESISEASSSHNSLKASKFYLRASLGGSLKVRSEFQQTGNAVQSRSIGHGFQATGSIGYAFNDILRVEGEVGYLGKFKVNNINGESQNIEGALFGVNAFADLGTIVGFTPYIGAGIGGVKFKDSETRLRLNAQAGLAYKINEKLSLEFGYEYSHISSGDIKFNDVSFEQDEFDTHMIKIGTRFKF
jgi:opacity protein-like surface antigen